MKRTLSFKTVAIFGLLATLTTVVGTGIQQAAQAQAQTEMEAQVEEDATPALPGFCGNGFKGFSPQFYGEDGNFFFYEFIGIEFTPEQEAVYAKAKERLQERGEAVNAAFVPPNAPIGVRMIDPNKVVPQKVFDNLDTVLLAVNSDNIPNAEQVDALNEQYSQGEEFELFQREGIKLTPEQVLEARSIDREFEFAMMSAFTPEQRAVYLDNLDVKYAIPSCDTDPSDG